LAAGLEEAPAETSRTWRKRARHSVDAGGLVAAFKTLFATGGTVKVAASKAAKFKPSKALKDGLNATAAKKKTAKAAPAKKAAAAKAAPATKAAPAKKPAAKPAKATAAKKSAKSTKKSA
jgi:DNA-binding protein HU-beta